MDPRGPGTDGDDPGDDAMIGALARARRRAAVRVLLFALAFGALAAGVQTIAGCPGGGCVLWATPERAGAYGMVMGVLVAML